MRRSIVTGAFVVVSVIVGVVAGCEHALARTGTTTIGATVGTVSPPIPDGEKVVRDSNVAVDACYRKTLHNEPEAHGRWAFQLVLSPEGRVVALKGDPEPTISESLRVCVTDVMTRLSFQKPGNPSPTGDPPHLFVSLDFLNSP